MDLARKQYPLFLVALILLNPAETKNMCDLKDTECLRQGAGIVYKNVVTGIKGLIEPIDPSHLDKIEGEIESVKYQLTNVTLVGFGKCEVIYISLNKADSSYDERLNCPQLVISFEYEAKGKWGTMDIDEKGLGQITANDYVIIAKGNYGHFISDQDQKLHYFIKSHHVETIPKGKLIFEAKSLLNNDKEITNKALAYMNENWKAMDIYLRSPIMEKFVDIIVNGIDAITRTIPQEEIFPKND